LFKGQDRRVAELSACEKPLDWGDPVIEVLTLEGRESHYSQSGNPESDRLRHALECIAHITAVANVCSPPILRRIAGAITALDERPRYNCMCTLPLT